MPSRAAGRCWPRAGPAAEGRRPASCPTRSGRGRARRGRPARRAAPGPGWRTARGCHARPAPGPAGRPARARRTWPPSAAGPRLRRPGRDQAPNAVGRAAGEAPERRGGAWTRPSRDAGWRARRLGHNGQRARADAWNCGACRKLHQWFGGRMLNRCQRERQRRTADLAALIAATGGLLARRRGGEDRRHHCKAISRRCIPRSRWPNLPLTAPSPPRGGWPRGSRSGAVR